MIFCLNKQINQPWICPGSESLAAILKQRQIIWSAVLLTNNHSHNFLFTLGRAQILSPEQHLLMLNATSPWASIYTVIRSKWGQNITDHLWACLIHCSRGSVQLHWSDLNVDQFPLITLILLYNVVATQPILLGLTNQYVIELMKNKLTKPLKI